MKKTEGLHLIDFVRPSSYSSGSRLSKLVPETSVSGFEARSFYEQLCTGIKTDLDHLDVKDGKKIKHCLKRKQNKSCNSGEICLEKKQNIASFKHEPVTERGNNLVICKESKNDVFQTERCNQTEVTFHSNVAVNLAQSHDNEMIPGVSQRIKDHRQAELFRLAQNGDIDGIQTLIQQGVDVNSKDHFGWTAAMSAAFEGNVHIIQTLVQAGADLSTKNPQGHTALSLAVEKRRSGVVEFIQMYKGHGHFPIGSKQQERFVKFYCAVCKGEFSDMNQAAHNRSMVHIFNIGKRPKDDSFLIPPSNVGFRLMLKSGWDGDNGLGPSGRGQKFPLKTLLKRDRKGLGNKLTDKARVTHFVARDKAAVASLITSKRQENIRTLSRRALRAREKKDRQKEIELRRQLS